VLCQYIKELFNLETIKIVAEREENRRKRKKADLKLKQLDSSVSVVTGKPSNKII